MTSHWARIALVGTDVPLVAPGPPARCARSNAASLAVSSVRHSRARPLEEALSSSIESAEIIVAIAR